jgi:hypothetical protein
LKAKQLEKVTAMLARRDAKDFGENADLAYLSANLDLFVSHRPTVEALADAWLAEVSLREGNPPYLPDHDAGQLVIRWSCPWHSSFTYCLVAVDPAGRFFASPDEAKKQLYNVTSQEYKRVGGIALPLLPGQVRLGVTVWPIIKLWRQHVGRPLKIGPILLRRW